MRTVTVLYHADADGFGAAYALWTGLGDHAHYIPVQYGEPVPAIPEGTETLLIVDFSYDRATCLRLAQDFKVVILDHHASAREELAGLPFAIFDLKRSGAMMAWDYMWPRAARPVPDIIRYVQDRDLWRFELPDSEAVNLAIGAMPWEFEVWDAFDLEEARKVGRALLGLREKQVRAAVERAVVVEFLGHVVPVTNAAVHVSEVGQVLLAHHLAAPFAVMYADRGAKRTFSLRSRGDFDVAALCRSMGGGGHRAAAGFEVPAPPVLGGVTDDAA